MAHQVPARRPSPSFQEATIYPLTGSWGKYFGSLSELSVSRQDFFEVENAYIRFVAGSEIAFFTSRVGVFHPWEGIGASDRPFSNARTLFQTSGISAGGRAVPYSDQPWGRDEVGLEVGGESGPWKGANQAVPGLGRPFDYVSHNTPDFSANVTYALSEMGGGLARLYYHCNIAAGNTDVDFTDATAFRDNFHRVGLYGSYPIGKTFFPQAGLQRGTDHRADGTTFNSTGAFAEAPYVFSKCATGGARYDRRERRRPVRQRLIRPPLRAAAIRDCRRARPSGV